MNRGPEMIIPRDVMISFEKIPVEWSSAGPPFIKLRPRQNGRHFADDIFKCILLNENVWITIKNSLKFVPMVPISNIPALVQIMAWRRPGDKPLSEPMLVSLPTHICVTRPQWVKKTPSSWYRDPHYRPEPAILNQVWYVKRDLQPRNTMSRNNVSGCQ